ncbi:bifunctional tRNA (5-methylaminomethyl-2-thiouridine)(34)-methyltransferase MnmD/FAD-dependent 5-carboxymethylaminomethyl-2-thiouridine(34) oxidoreductase MnmC [Cardiobacteriaceae bacterium TAE3-ERU3]|nr:bifunctional tRNA (5-methylaminomethyl-2-thiouridine)(34)-methyltransferase MnmD/FAD-dependent 5-carboxymethylaminomethyl-2-thiouridine(34) oxidoreductase MnmC [Cardiobacteriaceae bacterium TAE3-ERU3]
MPTHQLSPAELEWRNGAPFSIHYGDIFYNPEDGFAESDHTFINGNDLARRFSELNTNGLFTIGEIGFGSGLNFINTSAKFLQWAPPHSHLYYISTEKHPWQCADLQKLHQNWPLAEIRQALYRQYPDCAPGFHQLKLHSRVTLLLLWGDVAETLPELQAKVDAWFLDGFAPGKNPQCWTPELCAHLSRCSHPQTTAATFSAARAVREALTQAGFKIEKSKGFGRKRDMLTATCTTPNSDHPFWTDLPPLHPVTKIAVIGAGIAGSTTARALAESGHQVTIFSTPEHTAGSAVPLAVPYLQPSTNDTPQRRYQLNAWHSAMRYYLNHDEHITKMPVVRHGDAQKHHIIYDQKLLSDQEWQLDPKGNLVFNNIGAIHLPNLCHELRQHQNINYAVSSLKALQQQENGWLIGNELYSHVIICTGWQTELVPEKNLHRAIRPLRGQATLFNSETLPAHITCADHTIIPDIRQSRIYCGASYDPNDAELRPRATDDADNLSALQRHYPELELKQCDHFVAIRGATRDYLPLVGPIATTASALHHYAKWAHDARKPIHATLEHYPGLYIHAGLGSKGCTHAFLNAELITAMINAAPLPLPRSLLTHLLPARFTIRAIIRRQYLNPIDY